MDRADFDKRLEYDFGLTYSIEKQKLAYDMVIWQDGTDGSVSGPFAGHSHHQRVPHFEKSGWVWALLPEGWRLMPDGISGWRRGENPFPEVPAADRQVNMW